MHRWIKERLSIRKHKKARIKRAKSRNEMQEIIMLWIRKIFWGGNVGKYIRIMNMKKKVSGILGANTYINTGTKFYFI